MIFTVCGMRRVADKVGDVVTICAFFYAVRLSISGCRTVCLIRQILVDNFRHTLPCSLPATEFTGLACPTEQKPDLSAIGEGLCGFLCRFVSVQGHFREEHASQHQSIGQVFSQ